MRRSLVIMLVFVAVLLGLTACGGGSSKASTSTKSTPSSSTKPTTSEKVRRAKARVRVYLLCLEKHGVTFTAGAKKLTLVELRKEPKFATAKRACTAVPNKGTATTAAGSG